MLQTDKLIVLLSLQFYGLLILLFCMSQLSLSLQFFTLLYLQSCKLFTHLFDQSLNVLLYQVDEVDHHLR